MLDDELTRDDIENAILKGRIGKKLSEDLRGTRYRIEGPARGAPLDSTSAILVLMAAICMLSSSSFRPRIVSGTMTSGECTNKFLNLKSSNISDR